MAEVTKFGMLDRLSPTKYLAGFKSFLAAMEKKDESHYLSFGSKVPESFLREAAADVRVLGIGSGSGKADRVILREVLQRHNSVYSRVVEPSGEVIEVYKELVCEDTSLGAVKFDWRQQTAEEYFQTKEDTKFHLIHAVHVLYHVEDIHATLRNMWEQLADNGYMLVVMASDKADSGRLRHTLSDEFAQGDRLKTCFRFACDVKQWFDTEGISYVTSDDNININVTECFKEESEAGMSLLDFLTNTLDVSSEPEIESMALAYIRRNSSVVDDKILLKETNEVITAFKNGMEKK
ncbi:HNMT [Branchiostoma lanceolatum]|uniref:HNMT protein n=1 Tax=Branchiostoma lanceolatum TaxID=7740 RepID=A0A8K0F035_BRALA|nr:HNMT [Branchiostoma lanceolatum]